VRIRALKGNEENGDREQNKERGRRKNEEGEDERKKINQKEEKIREEVKLVFSCYFHTCVVQKAIIRQGLT
jgi:hypothetical protein